MIDGNQQIGMGNYPNQGYGNQYGNTPNQYGNMPNQYGNNNNQYAKNPNQGNQYQKMW